MKDRLKKLAGFIFGSILLSTLAALISSTLSDAKQVDFSSASGIYLIAYLIYPLLIQKAQLSPLLKKVYFGIFYFVLYFALFLL